MTILTLAFAILLQDQVDNPEFKGWAGFKPGSSITYKVQNSMTPEPGEQKSTLKSVGEVELVVEVEMTMGGKPAGKMERKVPAKLPADKAPKETKKGEEEVEVAGKKLECMTLEFESKAANGKVFQMKVWRNEEVPGMAAKVEVSSENFKNSMIATAWEKK
jgi:hypothetical protein